MILPDVNVLVYGHRRDAPDHLTWLGWLESEVNSDAAFGPSDLVVSGFTRMVAHPRVFRAPSTLSEAMTFAVQIRERPNCVPVAPGPGHWGIFRRLCESAVSGETWFRIPTWPPWQSNTVASG